jgi:hypothetical protein
MPDIAYLALMKSGGLSNVDPLLSLGGEMADPNDNPTPGTGALNNQPEVYGQYTDTFITSVAGQYGMFRWDTPTTYLVRVDDFLPTELKNGIGTLKGESSDSLVGESITDGPILEADEGSTVVEFSDGSYAKNRRFTQNNWTNQSSSFTTSEDASQNIFDDVGSSDAWNGLVDYRMLYFYHRGQQVGGTPGMSFRNVRIWVDVQPMSAQIDLGFSVGEINTEPATLADRFTAPAGITFQDYDSESNAIVIPEFKGMDRVPVWFRRTVFPGQSAGDVTGDFFDLMWKVRS